MGSEEALVLEKLRNAEKNYRWLKERYDEIRKYAAGCYVVVWREDLAAYDKDLDRAVREATKKGVRVQDALVDYIPAEGETWMF